MKPDVIYFSLLFALIVCAPVYSQERARHELMGQPYNSQTYAGEALFSGNENWSVVQNSKGLVYVANQEGVLEFDGYTWRLLELNHDNTAFSLDIDEHDVIYVGARGDLGYLVANEKGEFGFKSLLDFIPENNRDFVAVWGTHVTSHGVYFQTNNYLFRWDGKKMKVWNSDTRLHTSFNVYDRLFVKKDSTGLLELVDESLQLVPGGEQFANARVFMMESMHDGSILIGAQDTVDGPLKLFNFSESGFNAVISDSHLLNVTNSYTFYGATKLRDNYFALATLYDGVFIVDDQGRLVESLGPDRLMPGDITSVYTGSPRRIVDDPLYEWSNACRRSFFVIGLYDSR